MITLWLIRHAETQANVERRYLGWTDAPLTAAGQAQEAQLLESLQMVSFAAVLSSDLPRAVGLAERLARARRVPLMLDARLREAHFGVFEGLTYDEVMAAAPEAASRWYGNLLQERPPGGETGTEVWQRTTTALTQWLTQWQAEGQDVKLAVVSHGGPLRLWLAAAWWGDIQRHFDVQLGWGEAIIVQVPIRNAH